MSEYDDRPEPMSDREAAYEAGYDPSPQEAAEDQRIRQERVRAARARHDRHRKTRTPLPKGGLVDPWA